jgi:hypothetical protein
MASHVFFEIGRPLKSLITDAASMNCIHMDCPDMILHRFFVRRDFPASFASPFAQRYLNVGVLDVMFQGSRQYPFLAQVTLDFFLEINDSRVNLS